MVSENGKACNYCAVCGKESTTKCSNCVQVYYCSVEHQKSDWKVHKPNCHPFQILKNEKFGRYLVASRDIKPGEILLKESPLIRGPSQITSPVCVGCLQGLPAELALECDKCGWPICTNICQNDLNHKPECDLTIARGSKVSLKHYFSPHPTYQCLTVLRCLLLKNNKPEIWEKLIQLESHSEQRRGSIQWRNDREGVAKFIPRFFKCDIWNEEEILQIAGIVQINGHEVPLTDPPYVAIYYYASLIEHSCKPNLTKSFMVNGDVMFWAPERINKGDHLSICYSDALWGTINRQNHLMQTKMFKCDCCRCTDITELGTLYDGVKCNAKDKLCTGLMLPVDLDKWEENWNCNTCGNSVDYSYIGNVLLRAGKDLEAMEKGKEANCIRYIEHYTKWLPTNHYYICDVKIALTQLIGAGGPEELQGISEEKVLLKINTARELLKLYKLIAPAENRILGSLHFELHAGLAELGRRGAQHLNENFRAYLEESLYNAEETVRLLEKEPSILSEGQICAQAKVNVNSLKTLLGVGV